jgi:hypothetical protein
VTLAKSPIGDGRSLQKDQHIWTIQQHIRVYKNKVSGNGGRPSPPQLLPIIFDKKQKDFQIITNKKNLVMKVHWAI